MNSFLTGLYFLLGLTNPETDRAILIEKFIAEKKEAKAILAYTAEYRAVRLFYFPGTTDSNALIVGGVHGSELSSTELAYELIAKLSGGSRPKYNTWIIPSLFPDNAADAAAIPAEIGSVKNIGRLTYAGATDPNRQMPSLGKAFNSEKPLDNAGRPIEMENQLLLGLVQQVRPERIAMLHSIRDTKMAGIFADPRTDCEGLALGYQTDSITAVETAVTIHQLGGNVSGNHLQKKPTSLYYLDPAIAAAGTRQRRNLKPGPTGTGVSMGSWGSTAVCAEDENLQRQACILFTVEFPGSRRPGDYHNRTDRKKCEQDMQAYSTGLCKVFLECSGTNTSGPVR